MLEVWKDYFASRMLMLPIKDSVAEGEQLFAHRKCCIGAVFSYVYQNRILMTTIFDFDVFMI